MALSGNMPKWISLLLMRFSRNKNLHGEYKSVEPSAIPTVTRIAEWARDERDDISEVWVFGSAVDHDDWDCFQDDLDVLLVVPDSKAGGTTLHDISQEIPLSDHYLPLDVRVRRESDCEPWRTQSLMHVTVPTDEGDHKATIAEYAMKTGVCVWRRPEDEGGAE